MSEISLRMTYDPDADAAFIYITDPIEPGSAVSNSVLNRLTPGASLIATFDSTDKLLGIELLGVSRLLHSEVLAE